MCTGQTDAHCVGSCIDSCVLALHEQPCGHFQSFSTVNTEKTTATEDPICSVQHIKLLPEAFGNIEENDDGYRQQKEGLEKLFQREGQACCEGKAASLGCHVAWSTVKNQAC